MRVLESCCQGTDVCISGASYAASTHAQRMYSDCLLIHPPAVGSHSTPPILRSTVHSTRVLCRYNHACCVLSTTPGRNTPNKCRNYTADATARLSSPLSLSVPTAFKLSLMPHTHPNTPNAPQKMQELHRRRDSFCHHLPHRQRPSKTQCCSCLGGRIHRACKERAAGAGTLAQPDICLPV